MEPEQQLLRFGTLLQRLGAFPDRELIHQLTECARLALQSGGHDLARRIAAAMLDVLDCAATAADRRVPLFYALDSIVKNVGDAYQPLLATRIFAAFTLAFDSVQERDRTRLHHVLKTWNERQIFAEHLDGINALVAPWHARVAANAALARAAAAPARTPPATAAAAAGKRPRGAPPNGRGEAHPAPPQRFDAARAPPRATPPRGGYDGGDTRRPLEGAEAMRAAAAAVAATGAQGHAPQYVEYAAQPQYVGQRPRLNADSAAFRRLPPKRGRAGYPAGAAAAAPPPARAPRAPTAGGGSLAVGVPAAPASAAVVDAAARGELRQMLENLGEPGEMTLEELAATRPEIHAILLDKVRADLAAAPRLAPAGDRGAADRRATSWSKAVRPGPPFGADEQSFLRHARDVVSSLEARAAAAAGGRAPPSATAALAACARDVAQHLDMLVRRRLARDDRPAPTVTAVLQAAKRVYADGDATNALPQERLAALRRLANAVPRRPVALEPRARLPVDAAAPPCRATLDALYDRTAQCADDGLRFATQRDLAAHMDVVYRRNRERRERAPGTAARPWGPSRDAWLDGDTAAAFGDGGVAAGAAGAAAADDGAAVDDSATDCAVPADCATTRCRVCGEQFEIFWHDARDEWLLRDAVRAAAAAGDDGAEEEVVVHRGCRDATSGPDGALRADHLLPAAPRDGDGADDGDGARGDGAS
ncbi:hypothetical protein M885DRAFT_548256 [Pelagophyceae sp. CCMP2097]|nr:hypothetical protein M885DRAFT_548256 [Pelagophyceae sp. CCMP2097]